MKKVFLLLLPILLLGVSCTEQSTVLTEVQKSAIVSEVEAQARGVIAAGMALNPDEFIAYFSEDNFISVNSGAAYYATRGAWYDFVKNAHASVEIRTYEPAEIRVTPLSADLALNTASISVEDHMRSGEEESLHVVTTGIWKKEADGWKMIHAHESWVAVSEE